MVRAFTPPTTNSFVSESAFRCAEILGNESRKRSLASPTEGWRCKVEGLSGPPTEPLEKRSFSDQSGSARFTPVGGLRSERPFGRSTLNSEAVLRPPVGTEGSNLEHRRFSEEEFGLMVIFRCIICLQ